MVKEARNIQQLYELQSALAITNRDLYKITLNLLKNSYFSLVNEWNFKLYELLKEFMNESDYKAIMKANKDRIKNASGPSQM